MLKNRPLSQKNGELLSSILEKANISQRLCSINMGENDAFLTNFIYRSPLKFSRDFSYKFLSSIYHFVLRDSKKRATEKFDEIINYQNILDLNINEKLLIPALERHTLAIINIKADVFEKDDEQIIESYIQEIYPETFENYKNFLRKLDYQRTGLKNISNVGKSIAITSLILIYFHTLTSLPLYWVTLALSLNMFKNEK